MKVIHEMIDYLLLEGIITLQEVEVLEKKGFYDKPRYYSHDIYTQYEYKNEVWEDLHSEENILEETFLGIERQLEDKERRKEKDFNRSSRTKRKIRSDQKKGDINLFVKDNELWWQPPNRIRITNKMCSRIPALKRYKEHAFSNIALFWDHLFRVSEPVHGLNHSGDIPKTLRRHKKGGIRKDWTLNFLDNCDTVMKFFNENNYKLKSIKYIHPLAYCKLIQSRKIESIGWSLFIKIDKDKTMQITNNDGAFTLNKLRK